MELMQLKFCMDQTKNQMSMGGEIRRHASITQKVEEEMEKVKMKRGAYTKEYVRASTDRRESNQELNDLKMRLIYDNQTACT